MDSIKRVFSYTSTTKRKLIMSIVLVTLSVLIGIVPYYLVYKTIVVFTESVPDINFITSIALGVFACFLLKVMMFAKGMALSHENAFDILFGMRKKLAQKMMRLPMGELNSRMHGTYKMLFVEDIEAMEQALAHIIPEGISNTLIAILLTVILFALNWKMAILIILTIPLGLIFFKLMMRGYTKKLEQFSKSAAKVSNVTVEYINGMDVIKTFNQSTTSFTKYADAVKRQRDFTLDWFRYCWPYQAAYYAIMPFNVLLALPIGTWMLMNGIIEFPVFILCILMGFSYSSPILRLTEFLNTFPTVTEKEKRVNEILQLAELPCVNNKEVDIKNNTINFDNVSFLYDKKEVLKNISFTAHEGQVTALVGASGSGKSTTAKLLMRFWDIAEGQVSIGGIDIRDIPMEQLMSQISYVSQDVFLFAGSIKENILIGKPDASEDEVKVAATLARCDEFVSLLPNGYDTKVGDEGGKLSGGQRQRISIARALLKNAPIILLDEATSSTDTENEYQIQQSINSLVKNKTLIVIAHRLSTIVDANQILVFDDGDIISNGTHQSLLLSCEVYKKMWDAHIQSLGWNMRESG